MADVREKRVELILQQLEEIPTLPAVATRVLAVTADDQASAAEVVRLLKSDPALSAKILKLLRRADLGVSPEVTSIERAVVLLGFEAVRSAVLALSVFTIFNVDVASAASHFNREEFWKHAVAVGCCAEMLARQTNGEVDPTEAFLCGLLHDLGKIALDAVLPKSYDRVIEAAELLRGNVADVERSVIGLDHQVAGKRLAERWQLPTSVRDVIWLHGQTPAALPASVHKPRLVNLVTLADALVRQDHLGYSGNYLFAIPTATLAEAAGLKPPAIETVRRSLVDAIGRRCADLGLGERTSGELYQAALLQANRELGRMGEQLAGKNRRLSVRAKFFDALAEFHSELRADAGPQTVLTAIGQTAVGVLGVGAVAAFSLLPTQNYAETILVDDAGEVFEQSLVDCPVRPALTGNGPVLAAGEELEWLLAAVSPRLSGEKRFWICLQSDGICIGGVVWGAAGGEGERLGHQANELSAIALGWSLALRTAQIREESRALAEQLADANRRLQEAQSELLRSRTLVSVGEMAAGAAHEMNNPLAVISGRSQLLASQLSEPKLQHAARTIHEQSHRLSQIITDLMDYAKPTPPQPAQVDTADLVGEALHEAKQAFDPADRTIELTMQDVPPVWADRKQATAAVSEVIRNAIEATDPQKGHIVISAALDPVSRRVVISVADNGEGMDEPTLKRAFDPFFSAKPAGRRRGLGLAKALRWLEAGGGSIRLESRKGQGTRAIVIIPICSL